MIASLIILIIAIGAKMLIDYLATVTAFFTGWKIWFTVILAVAAVYAAVRVIIAIVGAIRSAKHK